MIPSCVRSSLRMCTKRSDASKRQRHLGFPGDVSFSPLRAGVAPAVRFLFVRLFLCVGVHLVGGVL